MATETKQHRSIRAPALAPALSKTPPQPKSPPGLQLWCGCVRDGNFWCDCLPRHRAKCVTTTKHGKNKGRRFWSCAKDRDDPTQCPFFVWVEDEEKAKKWLMKYGPQEAPSTPRRLERGNEETPWTKSKRKGGSGEASDEDENGNAGLSERRVDDGFVFIDADEEDDSPSRRATKRTRIETLGGKPFVEKLREVALPPTPQTLEKGKGKERAIEIALIEHNHTSTPGTSKDPLNFEEAGNGDLTTKILNLLRKDKVQLKESTVERIRLEIDLELRSNAAKVSIYEGAVSRLSKRLDGLESNATNWTRVDDPIELSD